MAIKTKSTVKHRRQRDNIFILRQQDLLLEKKTCDRPLAYGLRADRVSI